jgi:hypothetical protein
VQNEATLFGTRIAQALEGGLEANKNNAGGNRFTFERELTKFVLEVIEKNPDIVAKIAAKSRPE